MREVHLQPADIVFVHSDGLVGYLIRRVTRGRNEGQTYVNHVALVSRAGTIPLDAKVPRGTPRLWPEIVDAQPPTVKVNPMSAYVGEMVAVYRPRTLNDGQRRRIVARALQFDGNHYGIGKILLHLIGLGGLCHVDRWPICSYTVAVPFAEEGFAFGAVGARAADPDDIWDWCRRLPHLYECVRPLSILEG